jgi:hypothetical protein
MKWFAVAMMTVNIRSGYAHPTVTRMTRRSEGRRCPNVRRLMNGSGERVEELENGRRGVEGREGRASDEGKVAIVIPISSEYPKCSEGMAAILDVKFAEI